MKRLALLAFGPTLLLASGLAHAHEAWLEPRPAGGFAVLYGHGEKKDPFDPAKVQALRAFDGAGRALPLTSRPEAEGLSLTVDRGTPALLTVFLDNGFWSRSAPGEPSRNVPMNQNPGATSGMHSLKTGKTVLAWSPAVTQPRGLRLEIVPTAATAPRAGGLLPVQVLWDGQPLAGAKLGSGGHGPGLELVTDAMGRASVPVASGWQMVVASHELPLTGDPRADKVRWSANLFFSAP